MPSERGEVEHAFASCRAHDHPSGFFEQLACLVLEARSLDVMLSALHRLYLLAFTPFSLMANGGCPLSAHS
jgi:hypothetical protein